MRSLQAALLYTCVILPSSTSSPEKYNSTSCVLLPVDVKNSSSAYEQRSRVRTFFADHCELCRYKLRTDADHNTNTQG